jgi:hypothetical protein
VCNGVWYAGAALVKAALASLVTLRAHLTTALTGLRAREPPPRKETYSQRELEPFEKGRGPATGPPTQSHPKLSLP